MTADICVVVPTVRDDDCVECIRSYAANARAHDFDTDRLHVVLVTEDFCDTARYRETLAELGLSGAVFDEVRRESWLAAHGVEAYGHLIPEASHAQTSFGLLYLWANDFPYGVFIDDDTRPHSEDDFFGRHLSNLHFGGDVETVRSDTRWVNVLYQTDTDLYPRGYPYAAMGETVEVGVETVSDVVASQGLWTDVPDLDAVRILMDGDLQGQAQTRMDRADFERDFVAEPDQYLTVCSMNLAFRREVVPAFYQLPMDDNPWSVGRFDDIWSGVFLKRACDVRGSSILTGFPLCTHDKAPRSTFDDLAAEVPGLELNEQLWRLIDDVGTDATSYAEVFDAMADALVNGDHTDLQNGEFLTYVGEHMHDWLDCLDALTAQRTPVPADD